MSKMEPSELRRGIAAADSVSSILETDGEPILMLDRAPPALTREDGGASRDRTGDLKLAKLALSQLSYGPMTELNRGVFHFLYFVDFVALQMVGREGVEPSTSRLSGVRSNHLSYRPPPLPG